MIKADLFIGIITLIIAAIVWVVTRDLTFLGTVFVDASLWILGFLGAFLCIKGVVRPERLRFFESAVERDNILIGVALLIAYLLLMPKVGFLLASCMLYTAFNWYLSNDRSSTKEIIRSVVLSLIVVTGFYLIFYYILQVPLPKGSWFE